jgi:hypothetical protein
MAPGGMPPPGRGGFPRRAMVLGRVVDALDGLDLPPYLDPLYDPPLPGFEGPAGRYHPTPVGLDYPGLWGLLMDLVESFFVTSAGHPLGLVDNAILISRRASMLARSMSAGKAYVTLCAVQYGLGPNTTIAPSTSSINTMMRSHQTHIRLRGLRARSFAV